MTAAATVAVALVTMFGFLLWQLRKRALTSSDPCPACHRNLDYDDNQDSGSIRLIHPDPQCGWQPDGYPSTRRGQAHDRDTGRS